MSCLAKFVYSRLYILVFFTLVVITAAHSAKATMTQSQITEAINEQTTGRMPGARIVNASCNPEADLTQSNANTNLQAGPYYPNRSCESQGITRDNFTVQIAFDPTNFANGTTTETIRTLAAPNGVTQFYDSDGNLISGANANNIVHTAEGAIITYNGSAVYPSTASTVQRWPTSGNFLDVNRQPDYYDVLCNGNNPGTPITYVDGANIYDANCNPVQDCRNMTAVSGQPIYTEDVNGNCGTTTVPGYSGPMRSVTVERDVTVNQSLFLRRFNANFSSDAKTAINALNPAERTIWLGDGSTQIIHPVTRVSFEFRYDGNYACIYAYTPDAPEVEWRVTNQFPESMEQVLDLIDAHGAGYVPFRVGIDSVDHCVIAPPPPVPQQVSLSFSSVIADVCTQYDTSQARWVAPFTGIVVQCIEETLMNIFIPPTVVVNGVETVADNSFFSVMQQNMVSLVRGLLALYVIIFGYRLLVTSQVPDRSEWTWLLIKAALVIVFAVGPGMVNLFPQLIIASKHLSLMVLEAGMGEIDSDVRDYRRDLAEKNRLVGEAQDDLLDAQRQVARLDSQWATSSQNVVDAQTQLNNAQGNRDRLCAIRDDARTVKDASYRALQAEQANVTSVGNIYNTRVQDIATIAINAVTRIRDRAQGDMNTALALLNASRSDSSLNADPTNGNWQDAGMSLAPGQPFTISVSGTYSFWGSNIGTCAGKTPSYVNGFIDTNNCFLTNGEGLVAYLGNSPPSSNDITGLLQHHDQTTNLVATNTVHIGDNGGTGQYSYTPTTANDQAIFGNNSTLRMYLMYYDACATCHHDNRGGYTVSINTFDPALQADYNAKRGIYDDAVALLNRANALSTTNLTATQVDSLIADLMSVVTDANTLIPNVINPTSVSTQITNAEYRAENAAATLCTAGGICYWGAQRDINGDGDYNDQGDVNVAEGDLIPGSALISAQNTYNDDLRSYNEAQARCTAATTAYNNANSTLTTQQNSANNSSPSGPTYTAAQGAVSNAQAELLNRIQDRDDAVTALNNFLRTFTGNTNSPTGYNYCDFRYVPYNLGFEHMRLWDTVDCKISQYLGIGHHDRHQTAPKLIWVAVASIISSPIGIPIFIITMIVLTFIVMVVVRVVHIYILAFMGLVMLVYISPLVIPAALFKFTNSIFEAWYRQILSYLIQPVILFGFMAFMFAAMDGVVFGNNNNFVSDRGYPVPYFIAHKYSPASPATDISHCNDGTAVACIYQTISLNSHELTLGPVIRTGIHIHTASLSGGVDNNLVIGLLKLLLICFIVNVLLPQVEKLAAALTNSMSFSGLGGNLGAMKVTSPGTLTAGAARRTGNLAAKVLRKGIWLGGSPYDYKKGQQKRRALRKDIRKRYNEDGEKLKAKMKAEGGSAEDIDKAMKANAASRENEVWRKTKKIGIKYDKAEKKANSVKKTVKNITNAPENAKDSFYKSIKSARYTVNDIYNDAYNKKTEKLEKKHDGAKQNKDAGGGNDGGDDSN